VIEKKIVLVGCGLIGGYHLLGLLRLDNISVQIVEPNKEAQKIAKQHISAHNSNHIRFEFLEDISAAHKNPDLTIVATTARDRANLIKKLLSIGHKYFLIEKMVCQSKKEYDSLLENFQQYNAKGWVNTIRRYNEIYRNLIPFFQGNIFSFNAVASNLGLGCNAIHYLDIFKMLNGDSNITLNGDYLSQKLLPNKRGSDLIEFSGTIAGGADNGSFVSVAFLTYTNLTSDVSIIGESKKAFIDEIKGKVFLSDAKEHLQRDEYYFKEPRVSETTPLIVSDILEKKSCLLPALEDSYNLHTELFRIFNDHLKSIMKKSIWKCPIT
jgi:hypothetical protein